VRAYICTRRTVPPAGHGWSEQRFISLPKATDNNFSLEMHATHKKPMQAMDRTTKKATVLGLFSSLREKIKEMTAKCTSLCYDMIRAGATTRQITAYLSWMHS